MNEDEYGNCPNCGMPNLHITELGDEQGVICCINCKGSVIMQYDAFKESLEKEPLTNPTPNE